MGLPHGLLHGSHMNKCKAYKFVTGNKEEDGVLLEGGAEEPKIL
jgi:hypothetical protein